MTLSQFLGQARALEQPVFEGRRHSHMTVLWVFGRLVRKLVRKQGSGKGGGGGGIQKGGGGWTWRPVTGAPLAPVL